MADTKISALATTGGVTDTDLFVMVDDLSGTPVTVKVAASVVKTYLNIPAPAINGVLDFGERLNPAPSDTTGNCLWQPSALVGSNNLVPGYVLTFKNSGSVEIKSFVRGVVVPSNYDGTTTVAFKIRWFSTGTSGNVVWTAKYRAISGTEGSDQATFQESLTTTSAVNGTARTYTEASLTVTAANLAAGDTLQIQIGRDKSSGSDTLAADAHLDAAWLSY